jgi:hypothetical protein
MNIVRRTGPYRQRQTSFLTCKRVLRDRNRPFTARAVVSTGFVYIARECTYPVGFARSSVSVGGLAFTRVDFAGRPCTASADGFSGTEGLACTDDSADTPSKEASGSIPRRSSYFSLLMASSMSSVSLWYAIVLRACWVLMMYKGQCVNVW